MGALVITHYQRLLNHITPEFVHILVDGRIVVDGGPELAEQLEADGYERLFGTRTRSDANSLAGDCQEDDDHCQTPTPRTRPSIGEATTSTAFHDAPRTTSSRPSAGSARDRARHLRAQERAGVDARLPPQGATSTSSTARCPSGAATCSGSTSTTSTTTSSRPRTRPSPGRTCRDDIKDTWDRLGIPEAERKFLAGVGAQYESRGRLPQAPRGPRGAGRALPRHGLGPARAPGDRARSTSGRSSRRTTTSSRRSTPPCGRAGRSSTCRRACTSRCRCRPTSASTPRTWASSSAR